MPRGKASPESKSISDDATRKYQEPDATLRARRVSDDHPDVPAAQSNRTREVRRGLDRRDRGRAGDLPRHAARRGRPDAGGSFRVRSLGKPDPGRSAVHQADLDRADTLGARSAARRAGPENAPRARRVLA